MNESRILLLVSAMLLVTGSKQQLFAQIIKRDTIKVYDVYHEDKNFSDPENRVYDMVEVAAKFPGGQDSLWTYIEANKKSPSKNISRNDGSLILVKCIIEKNGCVTNAKVILSADKKFNDEALQIVNSMPQWKPALQDGEPVRAFMTIPFRF